MIALYAAVPSKTLADLSEKRNEIREGVAIGAFRSVLLLLLFYFAIGSYRRCGSVKVKLVLNFSMKVNSVYIIRNCKVFIQYLFEF